MLLGKVEIYFVCGDFISPAPTVAKTENAHKYFDISNLKFPNNGHYTYHKSDGIGQNFLALHFSDGTVLTCLNNIQTQWI